MSQLKIENKRPGEWHVSLYATQSDRVILNGGKVHDLIIADEFSSVMKTTFTVPETGQSFPLEHLPAFLAGFGIVVTLESLQC